MKDDHLDNSMRNGHQMDWSGVLTMSGNVAAEDNIRRTQQYKTNVKQNLISLHIPTDLWHCCGKRSDLFQCCGDAYISVRTASVFACFRVIVNGV